MGIFKTIYSSAVRAEKPAPQTPLVVPATSVPNEPRPAGPLPTPKVPRPRHPSYERVASVVGEDLAAPLLVLEQAVAAAVSACDQFEAHRPQGAAWKAAVAADFEDYACGKRPAEYRAAALWKSEPDRWFEAHMAARYVRIAAAECNSALDAAAIRRAAAAAAQVHGDAFMRLAAEGWAARRHVTRAWMVYDEGSEALDAYQEACELEAWAAGTKWASEHHGFPDPVSAGHWISLDLILRPDSRLFVIPQGVTWPEDAGTSLGAAFRPDPGLKNNGYRAIEDPA